MTSMQIGVILPAAGASSRFGEGSKLDADLAGRPVLQRTLELFVHRDEVRTVIVAGPHADEEWEAFQLRHADKIGLYGGVVVRGGVTHRWETVKAALEHMPGDCTHIAVHDAARPCTPPELIDRVFRAAETHDAVIPCLEIAETIKRLSPEGEAKREIDPLDAVLGAGDASGVTVRTVEATVPRERLALAQTPQVFEADLLRRAYAQDDLTSTDDAGLIERLGEPVAVVEGDARNIKITRRHDVQVAMAILGLKAPRGRESHKKF